MSSFPRFLLGLSLIGACVGLLGSAAPVFACSCAEATTAEQFSNAAAVFVGTVKNISIDAGQRSVDFDVRESQKGSVAERVTVSTGWGDGDCGFDFETGKEYVVYAYGDEGQLDTGICSGTSLVAESQDIDDSGITSNYSEPVANLLKSFNDNNSQAVQALTPFLLAIISFIYYKLIKERELKEGDAAGEVGSVFWTFGRKYKILAVHQFIKSEDVSGYKHLGQNSRPDQWQKLIDIHSSFYNLRHQIVPKNNDDVMTVIISRNGKEKWKAINFNK